VRKLITEHKQVKGFGQQEPYHWGYDVNPIDISYSSSYVEFDVEEKGARRRSYPRNDIRDLEVEVPKYYDNLNREGYLDCEISLNSKSIIIKIPSSWLSSGQNGIHLFGMCI